MDNKLPAINLLDPLYIHVDCYSPALEAFKEEIKIVVALQK